MITNKIRRLRLLLAFVALICLISACSSSASKRAESSAEHTMPEWVLNPASIYPGAEFLAAVGSAPNAELAQRNARGNIAQIFSSRIRQTVISGISTQNDNGLNYASRVALSSSTEDIVGIRMGESWYDPAERAHYTLAYLHKGEYARYLSEQIAKKKADLKEAELTRRAVSERHGDTAAAKFRILRTYRQQLLLIPDLELLLRHQLVVSRPTTLDSSLTRRVIKKNHDDALRANQLCLQIESEYSSGRDDFVKLISKAMADIGWQIRAVDSGDCLQLSIEFELELAQPKADWHFSAVNLGYSISDGEQSLSTGSLALDTTAVKPEESISRLKDKITNELPDLMLADMLK